MWSATGELLADDIFAKTKFHKNAVQYSYCINIKEKNINDANHKQLQFQYRYLST